MYNELVKKGNTIQTIDTTNLVEKAECNTKIGEIEKIYLTMIMLDISIHKNLIS